MSDDDTVIIRHKISAALKKPLPSVKVWHLIAIAVVAFVLGALVL
jgi:hypothetical protein